MSVFNVCIIWDEFHCIFPDSSSTVYKIIHYVNPNYLWKLSKPEIVVHDTVMLVKVTRDSLCKASRPSLHTCYSV